MKYIVSVAIDGRIDVEVEADSFEEARKEAEWAVGNCDWNTMECISCDAVNAEDENGTFKDY